MNTYNSTDYWKNRTTQELQGGRHTPLAKDKDLNTLDPHCVKWLREQLEGLGNPSVLEIGCGFGRWSAALDGCYSRFVGVDIVPARIEYANQTYIREDRAFHVISADGNWDLDETFDVAVFITVIQHLPLDLSQVLLRTANRHLSIGGRLILVEWRIYEDKTQFPENTAFHMISKLKSDLAVALPEMKWTGTNGGFILKQSTEIG